jgi:large subunit ribosomal protein L15
MKIGSIQPRPGANRRSKRRGLGPASGLGGTAGRGHKGQKARAGGKVPPWFEGGQMPFQRRLPKRGFTHVDRQEYQVVNVEALARFGKDDVVSKESLKEKGLISSLRQPVKILGDGGLEVALQVRVDAVSASARKKIEAAGGSVTLPEAKVPRARGQKKAPSKGVGAKA